MSKKVGMLIKEARTNAGFTQQELAERVYGLSASDISKAERNEKELTTDQLKSIAKATGVTQKSLIEAAGGTKKTTASKTTKSTASKTSTSKTTKTSASKSTKTSSTGTSMKVTAAEKRLVELYRKADADAKKAALKALKDEETDINDILGSILESAMGSLLK